MRMRTINEAGKYFKEKDPHTALTPYAIRCMVKQGKIPSVAVGTKRLVNLDVLEKMFSCEEDLDGQDRTPRT